MSELTNEPPIAAETFWVWEPRRQITHNPEEPATPEHNVTEFHDPPERSEMLNNIKPCTQRNPPTNCKDQNHSIGDTVKRRCKNARPPIRYSEFAITEEKREVMLCLN